MTVLYYDCFSGISGDMHLGAMIDLGVDPEFLVDQLHKLDLSGYELKISRDERKGISGTKVDVVLDVESHRAMALPLILQPDAQRKVYKRFVVYTAGNVAHVVLGKTQADGAIRPP